MKNDAPTIMIAILILFFIQQVTFLVESIYMLNLLNTSLNSHALGVLFFYAPIFLLLFRENVKTHFLLFFGFLFLLASVTTPWCRTSIKILSSGVAVSSFLIFMGMFFSRQESKKVNWILSLSLAILFSLLFRVLGATLDITVSGQTRIVGAALGLVGFYLLMTTMRMKTGTNDDRKLNDTKNAAHTFAAAFGFMSGLLLLYFVFTSPTVITRWTESSYLFSHLFYIISLYLLMVIVLLFSGFPARLTFAKIVVWNLLFIISLIFTIVRHTIPFPQTPDSLPVIVDAANGFDLSAILTFILAPVLVINLHVFAKKLSVHRPSQLALPLTAAAVFMSLLIFMLIFTNVWGYVQPVSLVFRNKFYLPFLLAGLGMLAPLLFLRPIEIHPVHVSVKNIWIGIISLVSIVTIICAAKSESIPPSMHSDELTIMSYNIQQGVDYVGVKNYQKQLEVIRRVNPDIVCLQESDAARISGGNSDVVRYFAQKLNYHSYYGPRTVTGTFGTAILSRVPLANCRTIFSYSNVDEIGTSIAEIYVNGKKIAIFNSHPAGKPDARHAHVDAFLQQVKHYDYIIAAGDYNFRQNSAYYDKVVAHLNDSWLSRWPDGFGDVSGGIAPDDFAGGYANGRVDKKHLRMDDRIDHIFVSDNFEVLSSVYLPVPESQSDHPAHWATLRLSE